MRKTLSIIGLTLLVMQASACSEADAMTIFHSPAWTPMRISGIQVWLRSDLGITQSGGTVSTWADQTGAGSRDATQSTSAKQPAYNASGGLNSQPRITFSGTTAFEWAYNPSLAANTLFMVFKASSLGSGVSEAMTTAKGSSITTYWAIRNGVGGYQNVDWLRDGDTGTHTGFGFNPTIGTSAGHSIVRTWNGNDNSVSTNYTAEWDGVVQTIAASGSIGRTGSDVASIGALVNSAHTISAGFNGDIYEFAVWNKQLSTAEMDSISGYAKNRYGL